MARRTGARDPERLRMMEPLQIKNVKFKNRILRSSMGGQLASGDGQVTEAFRNFERRFARGGVAGLVSATFSVNAKRYSPIYYPNIAHDRFVEPLKKELASVREGLDCRYILQIGDPGAHTQTSLFSQVDDSRSSSWVIDLLYGYRNHATALAEESIGSLVQSYADAARRAKEAGCDGLELTASKGYMIHQFLNPGFNRRRDGYGGSKENRFRFLREIVTAVREELGRDFLFGVRLSTEDFNYLPVNVRLPPVFPLRHWILGNGLPETTYFASELERLGVDYLHLSRGFGFPNPKETPGDFPLAEVRRVYNATSHLSFKGKFRALLLNLVPDFLLQLLFGIGWTKELGATGKSAAEFRKVVKIPLIVNGGFQSRSLIEETLASGSCDMVSMARPLLANPNLLQIFKARDEPEEPCTFCNRCALLTALVPVGCYEPRRFGGDQDAMEQQIVSLVHDPDAEEAEKETAA